MDPTVANFCCISDLPDELLIKILSFLSTKEAVQISLLAKRFQNLWASVPVLEFDFDEFRPDEAENEDNIYAVEEKFIRFVDGVFEHRNPLINLESFKIKWVDQENSDPARATNWLETVAMLQPKFISIHIFTKGWLDFPDSIFSSESLQEIDIHLGFEVLRLQFVNLPRLKKVSLHSINIVDELVQKLLRLPSLETMGLSYCLLPTCVISSDMLKCLVLDSCHTKTKTAVTISTPGLLYLEICSWSMGRINFENLESLTSARIHYHKEPQFLMALSNATSLKLKLSKSGVLEMRDVLKEETTDFPTFHNLKTLKLGKWCMSDELDVVGRFLFHAHNLEKLTLVHRHCQSPSGHSNIKITLGMGGKGFNILKVGGDYDDSMEIEIDELLDRLNIIHQEIRGMTIISSV